MIILQTSEYGPLKCDVMTAEEIDAMAKARQETITYLGIFEAENSRYMVYHVHNRNICSKL